MIATFEAQRVPETEGGHICLVVADDDAYAELAAQFLSEGTARHEKTVSFGPQDSPVQDRLRACAVLALDPFVDVLGRDELEPERMFDMFREESAMARAEGYTRLRVAADMNWLLPAIQDGGQALRFEVLLDRVVAEVGATVLCAYKRTSFSPDTVLSMICTHPLTAGETERGPFKLVAGEGGHYDLSGELDLAGCSALTCALTATVGDDWALDASGVAFADVAGMRAIALAARTAGRILRIRGASAELRRYWRLAGFEDAAADLVAFAD